MATEVYNIDSGDWKFESSNNPFVKFQMRVNKTRLRKAFKSRKYVNPWLYLLKTLTFMYSLVGLIILLAKLGL